jgi:hypothetical protein
VFLSKKRDLETPSRVILLVVRSFQRCANWGFRVRVDASGWGNMVEIAFLFLCCGVMCVGGLGDCLVVLFGGFWFLVWVCLVVIDGWWAAQGKGRSCLPARNDHL